MRDDGSGLSALFSLYFLFSFSFLLSFQERCVSLVRAERWVWISNMCASITQIETTLDSRLWGKKGKNGKEKGKGGEGKGKWAKVSEKKEICAQM